MTKEEREQAVKDINKYFTEKCAVYWEAKWVLDILQKYYSLKKDYTADNMLISDIAKINCPELKKERLF